MEYSEYEKKRLNNQINWYDQKSKTEKKWYYILKTIQIFLSGAIPVMAGNILKFNFLLLVISSFSALATLLEGVLSLCKFYEKWIQYRTIAEALKREKYMYLYSAGIYDSSNIDKLKTLVERCESLISSENINWANMSNNKKGKN